MRKKITEGSLLFVSVIKWFLFATIVGGVVGGATSLFLHLLDRGTDLFSNIPFYLILPAGFLASSLITGMVSREAEGHGTEKVIEAVHKTNGRIPIAVVPAKLAATVITISSGGSAGKEGPCAQIGAGIASFMADIFKFDGTSRKILVICGISAGFSAVFGTPIAGAIFGVEVLFVGSLMYEVLLPSFVAGITAYQVSHILGVSHVYHTINLSGQFSQALFLKVAVAGIFFGLISFLLVEAMKYGHIFSERLKWPKPVRALYGGILLSVGASIFSTDYLGLGLGTIENVLNGGEVHSYAFLMKILFTVITLNFFGSGGIATPIFFVGATAGAAYAQLWGLNIAPFAAIGFVSLLGGAANTPIAASIMAVELFGSDIAPYAMIACLISFMMTGHRSVYPSQILAMKKTRAVKVETGRVVDDLVVEFEPGRSVPDKWKRPFSGKKDKSKKRDGEQGNVLKYTSRHVLYIKAKISIVRCCAARRNHDNCYRRRGLYRQQPGKGA